MSYNLNLVTLTDDYADRTTLITSNTTHINLFVYDNPIVYQFAYRQRNVPSGGEVYAPEVTLTPGFYSFRRRVERMRFRNLYVGRTARLTVEALTRDEWLP